MVLLYTAEVRIELKPGVADPEGANTKKALELLGFSGLKAVKSVHAFSLDLDAPSEATARKQVEEMCKRLLVNPVIHVPRITLSNGSGGAKKATKALTKPAPKSKTVKPRGKTTKAVQKTVSKARRAVDRTAKKVASKKRGR